MARYSSVAKGLVLLFAVWFPPGIPGLMLPGPAPGPARAERSAERLALGNAVLEQAWSLSGQRLTPLHLTDRASSRTLDLHTTEVFQVLLEDGRRVVCSALKLVGEPQSVELPADPGASTLGRRLPGRALIVELASEDGELQVEWKAMLRDGANAVRQEVAFTAPTTNLTVKEIILVEVPAWETRFAGSVPGSPLLFGNFFFAYEHPSSTSRWQRAGSANLALGKPVTASGQFRDLAPERAVDGDESVDRHWGCAGLPAWLQVDLGEVHAVDAVQLTTYWDGERSYQYRIELSTNEQAWHTAVDARTNRSPATPQGWLHEFAPRPARHVRTTFTGNSAGNHLGAHVVELRVFQALDGEGARGRASRAQCLLALDAPLPRAQPSVHACAMGVVPEGQLRRGFLYYLERERAHPYRPFLHYNSWYDISGSQRKFGEEDCLRVVRAWGRELTGQRGLSLASFAWDDGWDDPRTLWRPSSEGFPQGFSNVLAQAREYGSANGFWLSPFGGYGQAARDRYAYGREQGFEFKGDRFALAGLRYHARFLETCLEMIEAYGANFFKFDGLTPDVPETEAMLRLTRALRARRPDLFISITTGTWPSPFWLWHGDSTWRGGGDMGAAGEGSPREQWLTYRDMTTYRNVVRRAPLYPLNSIMNQGIAHSHHGRAGRIGDCSEELRREIRSFFACGTCLQELYIAADRMAPENWDDLVEAAKWSQANADVLVDTHWIGGDPAAGQVYGWASWCERKGIVCLRNPSSRVADFALDVGEAFELPASARRVYRLRSPWRDDAAAPELSLTAGAPYTLTLKPFQVVVLEAFPSEKR